MTDSTVFLSFLSQGSPSPVTPGCGTLGAPCCDPTSKQYPYPCNWSSHLQCVSLGTTTQCSQMNLAFGSLDQGTPTCATPLLDNFSEGPGPLFYLRGNWYLATGSKILHLQRADKSLTQKQVQAGLPGRVSRAVSDGKSLLVVVQSSLWKPTFYTATSFQNDGSASNFSIVSLDATLQNVAQLSFDDVFGTGWWVVGALDLFGGQSRVYSSLDGKSFGNVDLSSSNITEVSSYCAVAPISEDQVALLGADKSQFWVYFIDIPSRNVKNRVNFGSLTTIEPFPSSLQYASSAQKLLLQEATNYPTVNLWLIDPKGSPPAKVSSAPQSASNLLLSNTDISFVGQDSNLYTSSDGSSWYQRGTVSCFKGPSFPIIPPIWWSSSNAYSPFPVQLCAIPGTPESRCPASCPSGQICNVDTGEVCLPSSPGSVDFDWKLLVPIGTLVISVLGYLLYKLFKHASSKKPPAIPVRLD